MRIKRLAPALLLTVVALALMLWFGFLSSPLEMLTTDKRPNSEMTRGDQRHPQQYPHERQDPNIVRHVPGEDDEGAAIPSEQNSPADLFKRKWEEDRLLLGPELHQEMEQLWTNGRKNRGLNEGIQQLHQLLDKFPNTNRAGCAAFELGHSYIRNRNQDLQGGREAAQKYWQLAIDRYSKVICENNAAVSDRAKLGLATWVYRYTDPVKARKVLEEVIANQQQEATPTDRIPPAITARRMLETIVKNETSGQGE